MADKKNTGRPERDRIKNITDLVHPEDRAASGTRRGNGAGEAHNTHRRSASGGNSSAGRLRKEPKVPGSGRHSAAKAVQTGHARGRLSMFARLAAAVVIAAALIFAVVMVRNLNTGSRHDDRGLSAYNSGDYDTAVREFKEALSYDGENAQYFIHLGMAYIEQKSYDEALGYFRQAESCAETDSDKILLNRGRGLAYLYSGSYQSAVDSFENALSYNTNAMSSDLNKDILFYEAQAYESQSDYAGARDVYSRILEISSGDQTALMKRGLACEKLEDYAGAESDLRSAIKKNKKNYSVYKALYESLQNQGKTDEASQVLDEALTLSGDSGEDYFCRGMIYIEKDDTENAADMFDKAYDKGYTAALLGQGALALKSEDYEGAAADYENYFSENNVKSEDADLNAAAYNQYALTLIRLGRYDDAVAACQNGLAYNSLDSDASLTFNLIVAYENLQQWENAYSEAKTYHEKYPDDENGTHEFTFLESRMQQ